MGEDFPYDYIRRQKKVCSYLFNKTTALTGAIKYKLMSYIVVEKNENTRENTRASEDGA